MNDLCEWWLTSLLLRFNTRENPGKQLRVAWRCRGQEPSLSLYSPNCGFDEVRG